VVNDVEGGENSWAERQRNERSEITCGNITEEKDIVNQLGNYADGRGGAHGSNIRARALSGSHC
jgi:hypothetical protein